MPAGTLAPYAQVERASGQAVGVTAYWDPRSWLAEDRLSAIEVGFTWLAASAQGTGLNTEAKLLLFRHAFESWGVVLRNWSRSWAPGESGRLRDSAIFSVIAEEWPQCRARLEERLARKLERRTPDTGPGTGTGPDDDSMSPTPVTAP